VSKTERRRPTMVDVAQLAGLSHQTVSRVLNDQPGVKPETRERVLAAIDTLEYRRNAFARALVTSRTRLLGVVVYGTSWYGPAGTLHGIQQAARDARYFVTVVDLDKIAPGTVKRALHVLTEYSPDGIVVITLKRSVGDTLREMALGIPTVTVEGGQGTPDIPVVCVDQEEGARLATEHLLSLGHSTVHHLAGPVDWLEAESRMKGWRSCLEAAGASLPPVVRGDWTSRSGYEAGVKLLRHPDVTAVFAANDQMALGLLMACREAGVRVPEEVSVVGFDCMPESEFFGPPLTTVMQDFRAVGQTSIQVLLRMIDHEGAPVPRSVIPPMLVVRASTAPPRPARGGGRSASIEGDYGARRSP
jgi:DNA-binding LacI/PurR family transcriptional regulator